MPAGEGMEDGMHEGDADMQVDAQAPPHVSAQVCACLNVYEVRVESGGEMSV